MNKDEYAVDEQTWRREGEYIFSKHNDGVPWKEIEELDIADLTKGSVFSVKDIDGEYITDEKGNNVFKAMSEVNQDINGPFINCLPLGILE